MSVNELENEQPMSPRLPQEWTWAAAALILLLGVAGFVRGVGGARPLQDMLAPVKGLPAAVALTAADATAMPHNDDWSVLSGPKILPPPVAKPAKAAASDDDESDAPDDQSTAAADVDAQAPDNAPAPGDTPDTPPPAQPPPNDR